MDAAEQAAQGKVDEALKKIDGAIESQSPALDESQWADAPEISEAQERALADAAKAASATAKFDDTNHADGEEPVSVPRQARRVFEHQPAKTTDDAIPVGKTVAQPDANGEDQEPEFDPALVAAAGLASIEEAKVQFGTPKALENAVRMLDERAVRYAEDALRFHTLNQRQQFVAPPPRQDLQPQTPNPGAATEFQIPPPPEGEEWDDATIALIKGLHDQFNAKLEAQRREIEGTKAFQQQLAEERQKVELARYVKEFDDFVDGLGDEWKPLLGEGSGFQLPKDSLALKNRVHLDSTAKQLQYGRQQQGMPELGQEELLKRALRIAFPQKQEQVVRRQIEEEVSSRSRMITARPTSKAVDKKGGIHSAVTHAESWYAKRGMAPLPLDEYEYDEI